MKVTVMFQPKEEFVNDLRKHFPDVEFTFFKKIGEAEEALPDAEIIVTMGEDLTDRHIERARRLKWIMVTSAGLEKMPFEAIRKKGIMLTNARGIHKVPMAEFTLGLMLQHAKQLGSVLKQEEEGIWSRRLPASELNGASLLVLGAGAIGSEIARLAKAFNMKTAGVNSTGKMVEHFDQMFTLRTYKEFLPHADYLVAVLPSTDDTKYILKSEHFDEMRDTAVFINIGRGDLVEESVLLDAVKTKKIGHIFLDVFEQEPLPADHPFWEEEGISVTPHLSSITKMYMPRAFDIFKRNLKAYSNKSDELLNVIDTERGY
ncbi:D-2-hydroxyacid dehydrogenase [Rossellomorea aquimaris]|uniref:3-phosphoglycerate dehydrogenase n=1 Tax=Rossellomorea aquimaris TaxID=189382 RepID=A0A1J6WAD8_9BACI|nr:D-2-hydroxyacid dehydrogenase [Rossellomorea aquimaris]OIU68840.1 3-phosphoglycerate dehydrogenase [Rossellomorea aquimaris]